MNLLTSVATDPTFRWNEKAARHLLNRAGFGVPGSAIKKLAAMSPVVAVAAFVDYEQWPDTAPPAPNDLPDREDYRLYKQEVEELGELEARRRRNEFRRKEKEAMVDLQSWWIDRMSKTQRPLQEKMALFWHGHFATSAEKVKAPKENLQLNQVFRKQGMGKFPELVRAVGKSPAMMRYLDQQRSRKDHPNENWARELMELFTLGIGNYTEDDIKEAARAFTGWLVRDGDFYEAKRQHDDTDKTIFGVTQAFNGDQVIDLITARPECAKFICTKLWKDFAYDDPEPEVIEGLAQTFQHHDMKLRPVLRQMFLSRAFYQEKAYYSQVKSPAQLVVSMMVQLDTDEADPVDRVAAYAMRAMGQSLFYPPNVKGWDGGRAWINTNSLMVRYNFSNFLVAGAVPELRGSPGANQLRKAIMKGALGKKLGDDGDGMSAMGSMNSMGAMDAMDAGNAMMNGGTMMAEQDDEKDDVSPVGQDAMPKDIPTRTFYKKLAERREEKRSKNKPAKKMTAQEKAAIREERKLETAAEHAPFQAREFFAKYKGKQADEIITALSHYFIGFDLSDAQRTKLKNVLAQGVQPGQPVPVERMAEEDLRATIQLLLSTVEYQVC